MHRTVVLLQNRRHNRQPQPGAAGLTRTRGIGAVETLEHALAIFTVNTRAVIAHLNNRERVSGNTFTHANRDF